MIEFIIVVAGVIGIVLVPYRIIRIWMLAREERMLRKGLGLPKTPPPLPEPDAELERLQREQR